MALAGAERLERFGFWNGKDKRGSTNYRLPVLSGAATGEEGIAQMPRYYFHFRGSGADDLDGQDFADDAAAIAEAKMVSRELRQGHIKNSHEHIVVTNEKGEAIHEEPLAE
jgi:hypothetical protein